MDKDLAKDEDGEAVEIKRKELINAKGETLLYTRAPGDYEQNPCTKKLNRSKTLKQTVHSSLNWSSSSDVIENVDVDVPGEVIKTRPGWRDFLSDILWLLQEERMYNRKRGVSKFKLLMHTEERTLRE